MKKFFLYLIVFISFFLVIIFKIFPEDPFWVNCSNEKDLYKYISDGWKIEKVHKKGDIVRIVGNIKYYYNSNDPQIILFKDNKIKGLNFGWRCSYLEGSEFNISRQKFEKLFSS